MDMADQTKTSPAQVLDRRGALGIAAAVAAFGAALGMHATIAQADDAPAESRTARTAKSGQQQNNTNSSQHKIRSSH
jgi:hypothetical protein